MFRGGIAAWRTRRGGRRGSKAFDDGLSPLQLAAEGSGVIGSAIRRWRRQAEAAAFGQPTAAVTRWRVSALPSTPLPVPGIGGSRWRLEMFPCPAGGGGGVV